MADIFKVYLNTNNLIEIYNVSASTLVGTYKSNELFLLEDGQMPNRIFNLFHIFEGIKIRTLVENILKEDSEVYSYDFYEISQYFLNTFKILVTKASIPTWESFNSSGGGSIDLSTLESSNANIESLVGNIETLLSNPLETSIIPDVSKPGIDLFHKKISTASTNATLIKGSASIINTMQIFNRSTLDRYIKWYNINTLPIVGTTIPDATFLLKAGQNLILNFSPYGWKFNIGLAYAFTANELDNDATPIGLRQIVLNLQYL